MANVDVADLFLALAGNLEAAINEFFMCLIFRGSEKVRFRGYPNKWHICFIHSSSR